MDSLTLFYSISIGVMIGGVICLILQRIRMGMRKRVRDKKEFEEWKAIEEAYEEDYLFDLEDDDDLSPLDDEPICPGCGFYDSWCRCNDLDEDDFDCWDETDQEFMEPRDIED